MAVALSREGIQQIDYYSAWHAGTLLRTFTRWLSHGAGANWLLTFSQGLNSSLQAIMQCANLCKVG